MRFTGTGAASWLALALCLVGSAGAPAEELIVAGAVSLRGPLTAIASEYEVTHPGTRVQLTFGASSLLAAQLRAGAPIDVFVSADERIVGILVEEGLVAPAARYPLARNRLVVMVRDDLVPVPSKASELVAPSLERLAMPAGAVPVGRYAREWLADLGLLVALEPRIVPTEHARATLAAVDAGHADAAIVYATDARLARSARLAFTVPETQQPNIVYAAALPSAARPGAASLFEWMRDRPARDALAAAGFGVP